MSIVRAGLLAAFVVAAGNGAAEERKMLVTADTPAVSVEGATGANYQTFYMKETVLANRDTIRGRPFVDKAAGVTCEWTEHGRSEADANAEFHIINRMAKPLGCVESVEIPEKWKEAAPRGSVFAMLMGGQIVQPSEEQEGVMGDINQSQRDITKVQELIHADSPQAVPGLSIMHTWDLSTNKVCLETAEIGEQGQVFQHKWGCFPITNQKYFDNILAAIEARPA